MYCLWHTIIARVKANAFQTDSLTILIWSTQTLFNIFINLIQSIYFSFVILAFFFSISFHCTHVTWYLIHSNLISSTKPYFYLTQFNCIYLIYMYMNFFFKWWILGDTSPKWKITIISIVDKRYLTAICSKKNFFFHT